MLPRSHFGAYLGRDQGPEQFFTQAWTSGSTAVIPKNVNLNRPLKNIILKFSGRLVVGTADYTSAAAESPSGLIARIRIYGTFKGGQQVPLDITGSTLYAYRRCFAFVSNSSYINTTRQADPNIPYLQTVANLGAVGTYDIIVYYVIPMAPVVANSNRAGADVPYYWQPQDWNNTLQIQLTFGDTSAIGVPAGGSVSTFTAFGSGTGSPQVDIYTSYALLGSLRQGPTNPFKTALVVRNEQPATGSVLAITNNLQLLPLTKQKTTAILIKTGRLQAGSGSVFATLRDTLLNVTQIQIDNKAIRNNFDNITSKEAMMFNENTILPQGYFLFSFMDGQNPRAALRADLPSVVSPAAIFNIVTNVSETNAASSCTLVQEMIYAEADDPTWAGTR